MGGRVALCGTLAERHEAETLLAQRHPEIHVESVGSSWELPERVVQTGCDVAVMLKGTIAEHHERLEAIKAMRRREFGGKILVAGAFLTERQEALAAGADHVFDTSLTPVEDVVARALRRPPVAADHPYLRALVVGEWARVVPLADTLPDTPPDLVLVSMAMHPEGAFWSEVARYAQAHPGLRWVLVDDGAGEQVQAEALASGVQPVVALESEGIGALLATVRGCLREAWLAGLRQN